jgi:hypothetical protein
MGWEKIVSFLQDYLGSPDGFKSENQKDVSGEQSSIYLLTDFLNLLEQGYQKKKKSLFVEETISDVEKIFDLVVPYLKSEPVPEEQRDVLEYVFRSSLGRAVNSYLIFSVEVYRHRGRKPETNWGVRKFNRFLDLGYEADIWFGAYLSQLVLLDKEFTNKRISLYESLDVSDKRWLVFIQAYLEGSHLDKEIFYLMKPAYKKVLENGLLHQRAEERLVSHLCYGYLSGFESLEIRNVDNNLSLFRALAEGDGSRQAQNRILRIPVTFIESEKAELLENNKDKVINYWIWTYKNREDLKNRLPDVYEVFLSRIVRLLMYSEKIDAQLEECILLSIPYADNEKREAFFVEALVSFEDDDSIVRASRLFKELLNYSAPYYDQNDIVALVSKIAETGIRIRNKDVYQTALDICNIYADKGAYFLKSTYEKYVNRFNS